jgi:hypothetical protein
MDDLAIQFIRHSYSQPDYRELIVVRLYGIVWAWLWGDERQYSRRRGLLIRIDD